MALTLKMRLTGATANLLGDHNVAYRLDAVSSDSEENKVWSKYTPTGALQFTVTNKQAAQLEPGDYLVTLTKVSG